MKKLNRKLIPAFAMLLLSAVLMSTASFAWFSSNAKVSATGIQVKATAPAAMWISNTGNGQDWATAITMGAANEPANLLAPATTKTGENSATNWDAWVFYTLNNAIGGDAKNSAYSYVKADGKLYDEDGEEIELTYPTSESDNSAYLTHTAVDYYKTNFYLFLEGKSGQTMDVAVKAKVTGNGTNEKPNDAIIQAMRIAVVAAGSEVVIFQPTSSGAYATVPGATPSDPAEDTPELLTLTANQSTKLAVYVWFEGVDGQCINANSINSTQWSVDFEFMTPE